MTVDWLGIVLKEPHPMRSDGGAEIWIRSLNDWEQAKPQFDRLCPAIIEGWKQQREEQAAEEFADAKQDEAAKDSESETAGDR